MSRLLFWVACALAYPLRRQILWLVFDGPVRLPGPLAPWLFGIAMGSRPERIDLEGS